MDTNPIIGYIDGSVEATTQCFTIVLSEGAFVQLDDLIMCEQTLPGNRGTVVHYGIVIEGSGVIEGATFATDTHRIAAAKTLPGESVQTAMVQVLRTHPEVWLPPSPGAEVRHARGEDRSRALFQDRMDGGELYAGLDHDNQPVSIDWTFFNGEKGGHLSVSGISGVATKTSYALFILYMLMETNQGRKLLGQDASNTKAVIFNVKGQDLLHIDKPNQKFARDPNTAAQWKALDVDEPKPFENVNIFVPPRRGGDRDGEPVGDCNRPSTEYTVYGWTPLEFIARGLLPFVFSDARDDKQISFVVEQVRTALARHAVPSRATSGAVFIREVAPQGNQEFERASAALRKAAVDSPLKDEVEITSFPELVQAIEDRITTIGWSAGTTQQTTDAFMRRLWAMNRRLGHLIRTNADRLNLNKNINVIDINTLHDDAQRFVVGAVLDEIWNEKQSGGRLPLRFVVLDELNKYAPENGRSPIKEILVDIAARGRSLGVILLGCQQNASRVDPAIVENAAIKVVGRLDASHADSYRFLSAELRGRATRFLPGTMVLQQPAVPAPLPLTFPFPPYATNPGEVAGPPAGDNRAIDRLDT